ncbi:hypothetical protein [Nonomuraea longicatena]|uniref:Uncharacterized protein n=1 Tax=Nonomuraea longicatena TaxID=83682 RepID=A0ABN1Q9S9_9ACTN
MDMAALASQLMPYLSAAIGAYGAALAAKTQDVIADETVILGQRLLQRVLKREQSRAQIESAVNDLEQAQSDPEAGDVDDASAALRLQLKKALTADPEMAAEMARMLSDTTLSSGVTAVGERVAVIGVNVGVVQQGDDSTASR